MPTNRRTDRPGVVPTNRRKKDTTLPTKQIIMSFVYQCHLLSTNEFLPWSCTGPPARTMAENDHGAMAPPSFPGSGGYACIETCFSLLSLVPSLMLGNGMMWNDAFVAASMRGRMAAAAWTPPPTPDQGSLIIFYSATGIIWGGRFISGCENAK
jgi:hypothetical protein